MTTRCEWCTQDATTKTTVYWPNIHGGESHETFPECDTHAAQAQVDPESGVTRIEQRPI